MTELQAANGELSGSVHVATTVIRKSCFILFHLVSSCFILFHLVSKKKFLFRLDWRVADLGWPAFAAA
jgi:hypothetical protein